MNSQNPPKKLIEILEKLRDGDYEKFQESPEMYLLQYLDQTQQYDFLLNEVEKFSEETMKLGKIHISQAIRYYRDRFYVAQKFKESDFFYFIRPFFQKDENKLVEKQKFLLSFSRILNQFTPPVILEGGIFKYVDKLTTKTIGTIVLTACDTGNLDYSNNVASQLAISQNVDQVIAPDGLGSLLSIGIVSSTYTKEKSDYSCGK